MQRFGTRNYKDIPAPEIIQIAQHMSKALESKTISSLRFNISGPCIQKISNLFMFPKGGKKKLGASWPIIEDDGKIIGWHILGHIASDLRENPVDPGPVKPKMGRPRKTAVQAPVAPANNTPPPVHIPCPRPALEVTTEPPSPIVRPDGRRLKKPTTSRYEGGENLSFAEYLERMDRREIVSVPAQIKVKKPLEKIDWPTLHPTFSA